MLKCVQCNLPMEGSHSHKKYCSPRCKGRYRKTHGGGNLADGHHCRMCGELIPLAPGQANKWLCSIKCIRASNSKSVREFHKRRPLMEAIYRARTVEKRHPDSNNVRFYRNNPEAPRQCESCGEARVTEIAHKPGFDRFGSWRSKANTCWPEMVWVLCPTCHVLIDRMGYSPEEMGLG